eukprot:NODE_4365_length_799_cov_106.203869_g4207_i0.p1 GENE.NODE_4365_length_799_cov_106.203869_g4207_i0~~NODE_4365_length_799_cov_106.203869_g4207_i0.p1  ORF type:complete len:226 (-),score=62.63 NODE_4365_length_799_cov_106.203869_g4207_i0:120-740(-)
MFLRSAFRPAVTRAVQSCFYSIDAQTMTVIDYMLKNEADAGEYYRNLSESTSNTGFKSIFAMLAAEEDKHYKALENVRVSGSDLMLDSSLTTSILKETKAVFEKMRDGLKDKGENIDTSSDQIKIYEAAREMEARNRDIYIEKAKSVQDPKIRSLFEIMAAEEQKHYIMIDEIVQMISKAEPGKGMWAESAEWNRLDDSLYDNWKY